MGEREVYDLLRKKPRLCSREIAEHLGWGLIKTFQIVGKMSGKDLKADEPTEGERERIAKKYPRIIHCAKNNDSINSIKVFELKNE